MLRLAVLVWYPPSRQKVCKVSETGELGLDLGAALRRLFSPKWRLWCVFETPICQEGAAFEVLKLLSEMEPMSWVRLGHS
jgi:hypothetical protein